MSTSVVVPALTLNIPTDPAIAAETARATAAEAALAARIAKLEGAVTTPPSAYPAPPAGYIAVPPSIDATGKTDVTSAYQTFVASVGSGTAVNPKVIYEAPGSIYLHTGNGVALDGLNYVTLWRYGSTLKQFGPDGKIVSAGFYAGSAKPASFIKILGGSIVGPNPASATAKAFNGDGTSCSLWFGGGSHDIEVASADLVSPYGHLVYIEGGSNYNLHDFTGEGAGLMGLAIRSVTGFTAQRFTLTDTAVSPIDFEDTQASEPMSNVTISDFTLNRWGWYPSLTAHAIQGDSNVGAAWTGVTIQRGILQGGSKGGPMGSTDAWITFWGSVTKSILVDSIDASMLTNSGWFSRFNNATGTVSNCKAPGASTIAHVQGGSITLVGNAPAA